MSDLSPAVDETLSLLRGFARQPTEPAVARAAIRQVRERHDVPIELVWEREPYTEHVHYDALIGPDDAIISLSVAPPADVPWPLRGVQRWSDSDLLRVDGHVLTVPQAIDAIDLTWMEDRIIERLVDTALILSVQDALGIEDPSDAQLQDLVDGFRHQRGLHSAEATEAWLAEHGLDLERLEYALTHTWRRDQVRDRVTDDRPATPDELSAHASVRVSYVRYDTAEAAEQAVAHLSATGASLCTTVRDRLAANGANDAALVHTMTRGETESTVFDALYSAPLGTVQGPLPSPAGPTLFEVLERQPPDPEAVADSVRGARFAAWLAARRQRAKVEWSWGLSAEAEVG